jgi:predicted permease
MGTQNPLVLSTGSALLLSALGSAALLDPASPRAVAQLAFVDALLGWFAQTTAPLTLFTTGLWMHSNSEQQAQARAAQQALPASPLLQLSLLPAAPPGPADASGSGGFGSRAVSRAHVLQWLLLRATAAPALMAAICWCAGFTGDLAHAMVILSLLPVAQTAFVVAKAADTGMAAISVMLVASLLVMLPQLMAVLALLERAGVFGGGGVGVGGAGGSGGSSGGARMQARRP